MFQYIVKRILIFIPTFFLISLLIFGLSKMAPGDPVEVILKGGMQSGDTGQQEQLVSGEKAYAEKAKELGLDKPTFYFSFTSTAYPADLYKIQKAHHRELVGRLINQYGNSEQIMAYYNALRDFEFAIAGVPSQNADYTAKRTIRSTLNDLFLDYTDETIRFKQNTIKETIANDTTAFSGFSDEWKTVIAAYDAVPNNPSTYKLYIPTLRWYGFDNQYHTWMFGDYPWLSSVDSTDYKQVAVLSETILTKTPKRDEFTLTLRQLKSDSLAVRYQIDSIVEGINLDSMQLVLQDMRQEINEVSAGLASVNNEIDVLFAKRDTLSQNLVKFTGKGFLRGDFGISYMDNRPVATKIGEALYWTLLMNFFAILISYLISIPLGVKSATWKLQNRSTIDNINTTSLFVLYSLPSFWIGTILMVFLTTPEYGLDWFPSGGVQDLEIAQDKNAGFWTVLLDILHHMILPIFCITYGSLAFLSRQMRSSMLGVVRQDYIRTARAKGLSERKVIWKHAFRNSLFPIITLFSAVFPRALSGSIAIELIYTIPGMGTLVFTSIIARDWPVVFTIVMFAAILTMIGNLIADILYAVVDPRVSFK
ncbi:MAG: ABC transporter permease subunit [Aureispira sp.]|nr:ABC transporter permease subunit [Aureispira sp.]